MAYEVYEIDLSPFFAWIEKHVKEIFFLFFVAILGGLIYVYTRPPVVRTISYIRSSKLPTMHVSSSNVVLNDQYIVHPKVVAEYIEANQKSICGNTCRIRVTLIQRNDYPIRLEIIGSNRKLLLSKHQEVLDLLNKLPAVKYYQEKYTSEYKQLLISKEKLLNVYKKDPKIYGDVIASLQSEIQMYQQAIKGLSHLNFWFVINPQVEDK